MKNYWLQLKPELPGLLFISVAQIWLCLNYGFFMKLKVPLNTVLPAIVAFVAMVVFFYAFLFPEIYVRLMNLEFFDDFPNPEGWKFMFVLSMWVLFHAIILYLWFIDYHHCSNRWYAVWYIQCVMGLLLLKRATLRVQDV